MMLLCKTCAEALIMYYFQLKDDRKAHSIKLWYMKMPHIFSFSLLWKLQLPPPPVPSLLTNKTRIWSSDITIKKKTWIQKFKKAKRLADSCVLKVNVINQYATIHDPGSTSDPPILVYTVSLTRLNEFVIIISTQFCLCCHYVIKCIIKTGT